MCLAYDKPALILGNEYCLKIKCWSNSKCYFDSLLDMIENTSKKELDLIILGDLNYDYVINESLHSNPIHYIDSLYEMSQLITEKTRLTSGTESTLDLLLTTNPSLHKHLPNYQYQRRYYKVIITQ